MAQASLRLSISAPATGTNHVGVTLADFVVPSISPGLHLEVGHISKADEHPDAFWTFCQNNPELMYNLSTIKFTDRTICPAIDFFLDQLHQNHVSFEFSNHDNAFFHLSENAITANGWRTVHFKDLFEKTSKKQLATRKSKDRPNDHTMGSNSGTDQLTVTVRRNRWGRYEVVREGHPAHGLVMDKSTQQIIGRQNDNGEMNCMTGDDIAVAISLGLQVTSTVPILDTQVQ